MTSPTTASPAVHASAPSRARRAARPRRTRRIAGVVVVAAVVLVWFVLLRPPFLGGSTHYVTVSGNSMLPTLHPDDLVVLSKHDAYRVGDVIAYTVHDDPQVDGLRVIHRVIAGSEVEGYTTQGDNRTTADPWHPRARDIMGRRTFVVPKAGMLLRWLKTPLALALLALLWVVVLFWRPRASEAGDDEASRGDEATVAAVALAATVRRPIRTPTPWERVLRRDVDHYAEVARAMRRRYLLEEDPAGRHAIRAAAFDLASTYGDRDPRVDRAAFLAACGVLDEAAPVFASSRSDAVPGHVPVDHVAVVHDERGAPGQTLGGPANR